MSRLREEDPVQETNQPLDNISTIEEEQRWWQQYQTTKRIVHKEDAKHVAKLFESLHSLSRLQEEDAEIERLRTLVIDRLATMYANPPVRTERQSHVPWDSNHQEESSDATELLPDSSTDQFRLTTTGHDATRPSHMGYDDSSSSNQRTRTRLVTTLTRSNHNEVIATNESSSQQNAYPSQRNYASTSAETRHTRYVNMLGDQSSSEDDTPERNESSLLPPVQGQASRPIRPPTTGAALQRLLRQLTVEKNILYFVANAQTLKRRLLPVVPKKYQAALIRIFHGSLSITHYGTSRTMQLLRRRYFWTNMRDTVNNTISECEVCQRMKTGPPHSVAPLLTIPKAGPWHTIGLDFYGPLPTSPEQYKYILVIMDHFTKWPEAFPCKGTSTAIVLQHLYPLIMRFGCPARIVTDNGTGFISKLIVGVCEALNIKKSVISPYHPQANGIAEAFMKVLKAQLGALVNSEHNNWTRFLPQVLFAYRSTPHPATGETPYYLLHGYDPYWPADLLTMPEMADCARILRPEDLQEYKIHIRSMQHTRLQTWRRLREQYEKAAQARAASANAALPFERNQLVLSKITPGERTTYPSHKFAPQWIGPHRVLNRYPNNVTYDVRNILTGVVRRIHREDLKAFIAMTGSELRTYSQELETHLPTVVLP